MGEETKDRPTKTITTTNGHKVILKQWITGREEDAIKNVFLDLHVNARLNGKEVTQEFESFKMSKTKEAEKKAVETVVVSVDGQQENVVDALLDMRSTDRNEVLKEVNKVTGEGDEEEKKS